MIITRSNSRIRHGLTLIETLVVVTLLGAAATATIGLTAGLSSRHLIDDARAIVRHIDALARLHAQSEGPTRIEFTGDRRSLRVIRINDAKVLFESQVPEGVSIQFSADDKPVDSVGINGRGQSPDYIATITTESRESQIEIAGLTGIILKSEDDQ